MREQTLGTYQNTSQNILKHYVHSVDLTQSSLAVRFPSGYTSEVNFRVLTDKRGVLYLFWEGVGRQGTFQCWAVLYFL
jgi:hypothetical protein